MRRFEAYIGIDYSGAATPVSPLKGLRVFRADGTTGPCEVKPPGRFRHWTRRGVAEWLADRLAGPSPILVGIDHGFSFPLAYFERHAVRRDWALFLEDFHDHWPTEREDVTVRSVRDGNQGAGIRRDGDARWLRLTERWTAGAKSVFQFDVQGQVAASTHAGLPWLRFLRQRAGDRVHFWPFDGWSVPKGRSVVAEIYPSLWMRRFPHDSRDGDQQAAYVTAAWLRRVDGDGSLARYLDPPLEPAERTVAGIEGWILGVM